MKCHVRKLISHDCDSIPLNVQLKRLTLVWARGAIPPLDAARVRILLVVKSGHARNLWKR